MNRSALSRRRSNPARWGGAVFLAGLVLLGGSAASPRSSPAQAWRLGLLLPTDEAEARSLRRGAQLAVCDANDNPRLDVRLVTRGRPGQWGTEGNEAALLALDDDVDGLITPASGTAAHQVLQVAGRTRLPVASLCPDASVTGAGIPWVVRVVPGNRDEARTIFEAFAAEKRRPFRWGAVVPAERAGREAARDLEQAAGPFHDPLRATIRCFSLQTDRAWSDALEQVLSLAPDGILLWVEPSIAAGLARAVRERGFGGTLAGPGRLACSTFLSIAKNDAEGLIVASLPESQDQGAGRFAERFTRTFGASPDPDARAAYDAAIVLLHALGTSPDQPVKTSQCFGPVLGATGELRFDQEGNRRLKLSLLQCRSGHFQRFEPSLH